MNVEREAAGVDEYYMTALQIFDYCGVLRSGTLRVDDLMDKFAPFVKTNRSEFTYLKSLLDPDHDNPEISVTKLATALHRYSESQKTKVDLDESFNLKGGQAPQDSDSGISTDGFQLLEELQSELREKAHLAHQLRSQLEFTDRQHEEALATLTAERDSLRTHLNMLREENMTLSHARRDYEEACDRLLVSEQALTDLKRELDSNKKRSRVLQEQVASLENEKLTLQEQLCKSKDECHRINEMYATRQSVLLEQNETLKTEHADLAARLQDHDEFMQQIIKEKVLLEMELKDVLNKSNQTHMRMDRSIDISYTDDQMLTALDSLNADSRFSQDNRILDEESFTNALKEEQGRMTNVSLFDEIRLSICNISRHNLTGIDRNLCRNDFDKSFNEVSTQTNNGASDSTVHNDDSIVSINDIESFNDFNKVLVEISTQTDKDAMQLKDTQTEMNNTQTNLNNCVLLNNGTQTDNIDFKDSVNRIENCLTKLHSSTQTINIVKITVDKSTNTYKISKANKMTTTNDLYHTVSIGMETDKIEPYNNNDRTQKCQECEKNMKHAAKLKRDMRRSRRNIIELQSELSRYEDNLNVLQGYITDGDNKNVQLTTLIKELQSKIDGLEKACEKQKILIETFEKEALNVQCSAQTDQISVATQASEPCSDCEKRRALTTNRSLRRFFWDSIKCLFQLFAVICFSCALFVLYGVTSRTHAPCSRDSVPWKWFRPQEVLDMLLRIEYVADVPM